MSTVRIVTDSNAWIPPDVQENYPIEVIPHLIKIGSRRFPEGPDFTADIMFDRLRQASLEGRPSMPELRAPDLNQIIDVYQRLGRETEEIIAIHMSSHLSPMWAQSRRAAEAVMGRYRIRVVDSLSTSMGLGILVKLAVEAAAEGADIHQVARLVNGTIPHLYVTFFAESLAYLERSANLGAAQSVLGTMLGIKAMLTMEEGRLIPLEKAQTREEVVEKLYEFIAEFAQIEQVGVASHNYDLHKEMLLQRLAESMPDLPTHDLPYTPSLAAHLGPNAMGVIVYEGANGFW